MTKTPDLDLPLSIGCLIVRKPTEMGDVWALRTNKGVWLTESADFWEVLKYAHGRGFHHITVKENDGIYGLSFAAWE